MHAPHGHVVHHELALSDEVVMLEITVAKV